MAKYYRHLIIPDTQVRPGVPTNHLTWANKAIRDYKPDVVIHLGDHWDMPSLSSYDRAGGTAVEGRRYTKDIDVGNKAWDVLFHRIPKSIRKVFLTGNHEDRISRAVANDAKLEGALSLDHLETGDFEVYPFLEPVWIHGICYAHYFANTHSGRAIGGQPSTMLAKIGDSFVQGHRQGLEYGTRMYPTGKVRHGLVAGSFYQHDEEYRGAQGRTANHWTGIVVLNGVRNGDYGLMPLDMRYLRREYS